MKKLKGQAKTILNREDLMKIISVKYNTDLDTVWKAFDGKPYHECFEVVWTMTIKDFYPVYKRMKDDLKIRMFYDVLKKKANSYYKNKK